MIIRSQDKKIVTKFHAISIVYKYSNHRFKETPNVIGYQLVAFLGTETDLIVAEYSTEEKAIEVLDRIAKKYSRYQCLKACGRISEEDAIFQMPSDESVEV